MRQRAFQKSLLSGRHIIEPDDAVARGKQAVDHVTADKARRAGDENAQNNLRMELKLGSNRSSRSSFDLRPSRTLRLITFSSQPYRLSEEVCRKAIRVPFNSKRLSRQT